MAQSKDRELARAIARDVAVRGGRAYYVGGVVRDELMGLDSKDVDIEVYGVSPQALREVLAAHGRVVEKGAAFGVLSIEHTNLDVAMPRRERRTGERHRDFDVSVDPSLTPREASMRRDFTINAMMRDVLTGELDRLLERSRRPRRARNPPRQRGDLSRGRAARVPRRPVRRAAGRADRAGNGWRCARASTWRRSRASACSTRLCKALLKAEQPSVFFRALARMNHLREFFPEVDACRGVAQNPKFHPEGDVFEHTMLVLDCAAALRARAKEPLAFMLAALLHDVGKRAATQVQPDGRITAYGHETLGLAIAERQLQAADEQRPPDPLASAAMSRCTCARTCSPRTARASARRARCST